MGEQQRWQADVLIEAKYWRFFAEKIHKKFEPLFLYSLGVFISEWKQICLFCKKRRNRQSCLTRFTLWTFLQSAEKNEKWMTKLIPRANQDHTSFQTRFIIKFFCSLGHWCNTYFDSHCCWLRRLETLYLRLTPAWHSALLWGHHRYLSIHRKVLCETFLHLVVYQP